MTGTGRKKKKAMTAKERMMKYLAKMENDPAKKLAFKERNKAGVMKHRMSMSEEERKKSKKKDTTRHKAVYWEKRETVDTNPYKTKSALTKATRKVERSLPTDPS